MGRHRRATSEHVYLGMSATNTEVKKVEIDSCCCGTKVRVTLADGTCRKFSPDLRMQVEEEFDGDERIVPQINALLRGMRSE